MDTIIIKKGLYQMPVTIYHKDGSIKEIKGGFVEDYRGSIYIAFYKTVVVASTIMLDLEFQVKINEYVKKLLIEARKLKAKEKKTS